MTTIGGPGGIGGPKPPGGPDGPSALDDVDRIEQTGDAGGVAAQPAVDQAQRSAAAGDVAALAAEIAAGRLTPREAVERLVDAMAGPPGAAGEQAAAERAELRELLADLVANDPYLASLIGRI